MNWYKKEQFNKKITLLTYDDGILHAIVNGSEFYFKDVSIEDIDRLRLYLRFWQENKALKLLMEFNRC